MCLFWIGNHCQQFFVFEPLMNKNTFMSLSLWLLIVLFRESFGSKISLLLGEEKYMSKTKFSNDYALCWKIWVLILCRLDEQSNRRHMELQDKQHKRRLCKPSRILFSEIIPKWKQVWKLFCETMSKWKPVWILFVNTFLDGIHREYFFSKVEYFSTRSHRFRISQWVKGPLLFQDLR